MSQTEDFNRRHKSMSLAEVRNGLWAVRAEPAEELRKILRAEQTARETYEAWPHKDKEGFPTAPPQADYEKIQIHRNVHPLLAGVLGFGFIRQDISNTQLKERAKYPGLLKRIEQYAAKKIYSSPIDQEHFSAETSKMKLGEAQAIRAYSTTQIDRSSIKEYFLSTIHAVDAVLLKVDALEQEASAGRLAPAFFMPVTLASEDLFYSNYVLDVTQQKSYQQDSMIAFMIDDHASMAADAAPNPQLLAQLKEVMQRTKTGSYLSASMDKVGTPHLFRELAEGQGASCSAVYDKDDKKTRINLTPINDIEAISDMVVHENRHAWQDKNFPELISGDKTPEDLFVAIKLREADAYATGELQEREREDRLTGKSPSGVNYETAFGTALLNQLEQAPWQLYEMPFFVLHPFDGTEKDAFIDRLKDSRFLQPAFLEKFCVAPNEKSYFPTDPKAQKEFITQIVKGISILHPMNFSSMNAPAPEAIPSPIRSTPQIAGPRRSGPVL